MRRVLVIEDDPNALKKLLDFFLPQEKGESFEPDWGVTICTTEEGAKFQYPGFYDFILIDHDLPDRGNGGRVLNFWEGVLPWNDLKNNPSQAGYKTKIIAISCVPINNERLLSLGANIAVNKMDSDWLEKINEVINETTENNNN